MKNNESWGNNNMIDNAMMQSSDQGDDSKVETPSDLDTQQSKNEEALGEASIVLESMAPGHLDNFNLLGVIANPRGGSHNMMTSSSSNSASPSRTGSSISNQHVSSVFSPTQQQGNASNTEQSASTSSYADYVTGTYYTFEQTIGQVTEQIEALNHVFEDWSRQYLEDYYYYTDLNASETEVPSSQLQPEQLPKQIIDKPWKGLSNNYLNQAKSREEYMETMSRCISGIGMKHNYFIKDESQHSQQQQQQQTEYNKETSAQNAQEQGVANDNQNNQFIDVSDIPELFFQAEFDLTDPKTFSELLILKKDNKNNNYSAVGATPSKAKKPPATPAKANTPPSKKTSLEQSTYDLFPIPPQDYFTGYLDKIEVALMQQVQSKSTDFFQQINNFKLIKEWVHESLQKVQRIQALHTQQHSQIDSWEQIPIWDRQRNALRRLERLIDNANELIEVRTSIGGLLSAKDDMNALEQIYFARNLLNGESTDADNHGNNESAHSEDSQQGCFKIQIGRLHALRTVGDQLTQYENLVVNNLSDELVEMFLEWSPLSFGALSNKPPTASQQEVERRVLEITSSLKSYCPTGDVLNKVVQAYGNRLSDVVRMTVRTTVAEFAMDNNMTSNKNTSSVAIGVSAMSLERFMDCLDMLFEQLLSMLTSSAAVVKFCKENNIVRQQENVDGVDNKNKTSNNNNNKHEEQNSTTTNIDSVLTVAAELSSKSVTELLRLRKDSHSLVSLDEMKRIWDTCFTFIESIEKLCDHKAVPLRSMLVTQAKAFVERQHETNMSSLVAALDSERWTQCEVSAERQSALTRLCSGRTIFVSPLTQSQSDTNKSNDTAYQESTNSNADKNKKPHPDAQVEGTRYKVVWSCLLLVHMIMLNIASAGYFQSTLASNVIGKVAELLRLFNSRTTHLVLGAGAIHSAARLKSINARHLSLVTQCLGMIIALLPYIRAALQAQLPQKQQQLHLLLNDLDQIKKEYIDHNEKVLNKFVTIIAGIVEHGLTPRLNDRKTHDFDVRAKQQQQTISCCVFLDGILTNIRKMHQVLYALLPPDHLQDVFSRILAYVDQNVPLLLMNTASASEGSNNSNAGNATNKSATGNNNNKVQSSFFFPTTDAGKRRLLLEVQSMTNSLNQLKGVQPWDFTSIHVLEKKIEYKLAKDDITPSADRGTAMKSATPDDGKSKSTTATETEATKTPTTNDVENSNNSTATPTSTDAKSTTTKPSASASTETSEGKATTEPVVANGDVRANTIVGSANKEIKDQEATKTSEMMNESANGSTDK